MEKAYTETAVIKKQGEEREAQGEDTLKAANKGVWPSSNRVSYRVRMVESLGNYLRPASEKYFTAR